MRDSFKNAFGLEGKVCVVTGAGGGIGRSIAQTLAGDGARIAVLDRNADGAAETADLIVKAGSEALAVVCDVSKPEQIEAAHKTVLAKLGDADVLVNNAGIVRPGSLDTLSLEDWNAILSVNLTGYFLCAQAFGRPMLARGGGALVHISSVTAECALPASGSYSVAKAGISMLSRLLALEWGPGGVRSNAILPGMIVTSLVKPVWDAPGVMEARSGIIPSRRPGYPEDIAEAVLYLASERASYVNGAELLVDGGFSKSTMTFVPRPGFTSPKS